MNILILGDSLSFPRSSHQQVLDDCWPMQIRKILPEATIWHRGFGGYNIVDTLQEAEGLYAYLGDTQQFDYCIIQVGIVDACPRPYPEVIHPYIQKVPKWAYIRRKLYTPDSVFMRYYGKPWISENKFLKAAERLAEVCSRLSKKTYFLAIAPAGKELIGKASKVTETLPVYNEAIKKTVKDFGSKYNLTLVDPYKGLRDLSELLLKDGHHLTKMGHQLVAKKITEHMTELPAQ